MVQVTTQKLVPISVKNVRDKVVTKNHILGHFGDDFLNLLIPFFGAVTLAGLVKTQKNLGIITQDLMAIDLMRVFRVYDLKIIRK